MFVKEMPSNGWSEGKDIKPDVKLQNTLHFRALGLGANPSPSKPDIDDAPPPPGSSPKTVRRKKAGAAYVLRIIRNNNGKFLSSQGKILKKRGLNTKKNKRSSRG